MKTQTIADKLARAVRILTVPPLMAAMLILALRFGRPVVFAAGPETTAAALLCLCVLPGLAYPLSALPHLRRGGRESQRDLAFALSGLGYLCGFLFAVRIPCGLTLRFLFGVYLFSVLALLLFNKLLHLRASGHACSIAGPMLTMIVLLGGWWTPVCVCLYALSFWASVHSGRHSVREYLLGTLSVLIAMALSGLLFLR